MQVWGGTSGQWYRSGVELVDDGAGVWWNYWMMVEVWGETSGW